MAQNKEENIAHAEKQDEENNYNELYPKPSAQLVFLLKQYLISDAQLNLGYYVNLENKRLFPFLLKKVSLCFKNTNVKAAREATSLLLRVT